jgi:uncharacterized protein YhaN
MNLLHCRILGFGKLTDLDLDFDRGLNLVFARNEGGKSTLQHFLLSLLYGQLRHNLKSQRRLDAWAERFRPWRASQYGGILWCEIAGGRKLEIHRTFGKDENSVQIRTAAGEDITETYEKQKNGELLFAKPHLGMPKDLFESVAVIRENKVAELSGQNTIRDRIANLAQTGDEDISVHKSLEALQGALEAIGSDRAPTKPWRQVQDTLRSAQEELKALETRRAQFQEWVQERNSYAEEVARLEQELAAAQNLLTMSRWRDDAQTTRTLEEIQTELCSLGIEIQSLADNERISPDGLEELNRLLGTRHSLDQRLREVRTSIEPAVRGLREVDLARQKLAAYQRLDPDTETIIEDSVRFFSLSNQQKQDQQELSNVRQSIVALEDALVRLGSPFHDPDVDWQLRARTAAERERTSSQRSVALTERLSHREAALTQGRQKSKRLAWAAAGVFLASLLAALGTRLYLQDNPALMTAAVVLGVVFAVLTLGLLFSAWKSRRSTRPIEKEIRELTSERAKCKETELEAYRDIRQAMAVSALGSVEAFLNAAKESEGLRQQIASLNFQGRGLEIEMQKGSVELAQIYSRLEACMAKVGIRCVPDELAAQLEVVRQNLRQYRESSAQYQTSLHSVNSLRKDEARLAEEMNQTAAAIRRILEAAGVDSPEAYREGCRIREQVLGLRQKEASLTREYERLRSGQSLQQWKERVRELEAQIEGQPAVFDALPGVEEAEQHEREVAALLASARENHARLVERVSRAFLNCRTISEIEEDLAVAQRTLDELAKHRDALTLALQTLSNLSREQQEVLAPQLNQNVERRFLRVCRGRYQEVKIDPDFRIWVRETGTGDLRSSESLSRGTQDQLYFALRFGVLDLVSNSQEPSPCLLDEPFVAYDRERMAEAFEVVKEEAGGRQLIIFTCREDLRELALREGVRVIDLPQ